jgi:hypothetical protein
MEKNQCKTCFECGKPVEDNNGNRHPTAQFIDRGNGYWGVVCSECLKLYSWNNWHQCYEK